MQNRPRTADAGFTLIELLVVVIIIGILAAIAIPTFLNQREAGWRGQAAANLRNATTNAEAYAVTNGGSYVDLGAPAGAAIVNRGITPLNAAGTATTGPITVGTTPVASVTEFCIQVVHPAYVTTAAGTFRYTKSLDRIENKACGAP